MYKRNQVESALLSIAMLGSSLFLLASTIISLLSQLGIAQLELMAGLQQVTLPGRFLLQSFSLLAFYPIMYLAYNGVLIGLGRDTSLGFFVSSFLFLPMLSLSVLLRLVFDSDFTYSLVGSWLVESFTISGSISISAITSLVLMLFLYHLSSLMQKEPEELGKPSGKYPLLPQITVSEDSVRASASSEPSQSEFIPSEGIEELLSVQKMSDFRPHRLEEEYISPDFLKEMEKEKVIAAVIPPTQTVLRGVEHAIEELEEVEPAQLQNAVIKGQIEEPEELERAQSFVDIDPEDYIPVDPESDSSESNGYNGSNSDTPKSSEGGATNRENAHNEQPDIDLNDAINNALQGNFDPDEYAQNTVVRGSDAQSGAAQANISQTNFAQARVSEANPIQDRAPQSNIAREQQYSVPVEGILKIQNKEAYWKIDSDTEKKADMLQNTLKEFGIEAEVTGIRKGPVITMFEILPASGVKLNRIVNLVDNIALSLAAESVRIIAPVPGKHAVGIEIPNRKRHLVSFSEILLEEGFPADSQELPVTLGKDITGESQVIDLAKTPHILIAGATGAGKSVCVNSFIASLLYNRSPRDVNMILIDPKIVELKLYNGIPHLLTPVITDHKRAFQALKWCLSEMERRYSLLDSMGVRDIVNYNAKISAVADEAARELQAKNGAGSGSTGAGGNAGAGSTGSAGEGSGAIISGAEKLPYIVVVIDEFADLMANSGKELEASLTRLAAMSRAVGIHLVLATQRPSTDVITGLIKANIPSRIAFMVASKVDSRIIIDSIGAEKLLGRGDMLFSSAWHPFPIRIQGTFLSEQEIENIVRHVKTTGAPAYIDEEMFFEDADDYSESDTADDPLMSAAINVIMSTGKASASYLQRRLSIGYNRAARLIEAMEAMGILGPQNGSKPREIIAQH